MPDESLSLLLSDGEATEALGRALGAAFAGAVAEAGAVLHLEGELGAGKTTCARSLLRALGVTGVIRSPTYTLVDSYEVNGLHCIHVDMYRLQSSLEVEELGLCDGVKGRSLLLIEWPEKGGAATPLADLVVSLEYDFTARLAQVKATTAAGQRWLSNLAKDTSLKSYVSNLT